MFFGVISVRFAFTMFPETLNKRSAGTLVAGVHKYFLAIVASVGYFASLELHHFNGQRSAPNLASARYRSISLGLQIIVKKCLKNGGTGNQLPSSYFWYFL